VAVACEVGACADVDRAWVAVFARFDACGGCETDEKENDQWVHDGCEWCSGFVCVMLRLCLLVRVGDLGGTGIINIVWKILHRKGTKGYSR
jgi:hypothetical protein